MQPETSVHTICGYA